MSKRVFIALMPDRLVREKFAALQQQLGQEKLLGTAKAVDRNNLHMTLHFIGSITIEKLQVLEASLGSVQCKAFDMEVNTVGHFPRPRVLWLGLGRIPSALMELEQQAVVCIQQCLEGYQHMPYRPHITLFRKVKQPSETSDCSVIHWSVKSFALVESKTCPDGVRYSVLKEWPLLR